MRSALCHGRRRALAGCSASRGAADLRHRRDELAAAPHRTAPSSGHVLRRCCWPASCVDGSWSASLALGEPFCRHWPQTLDNECTRQIRDAMRMGMTIEEYCGITRHKLWWLRSCRALLRVSEHNCVRRHCGLVFRSPNDRAIAHRLFACDQHWMAAGAPEDALARLREQLLAGTYQPSMVDGSRSRKSGGGYESSASDRRRSVSSSSDPAGLGRDSPRPSRSTSYGFRRDAAPTTQSWQAQRYVNEGRRIVVDVDLEKFFDRVNHDVLMGRLAKRIADNDCSG